MSAAYVIVVDDEPAIRELVREILSDEGYRVATAESADEARGLVGSQEPDLVLLDIWMPGEDGISLLKQWVGAGMRSPVVMISGHGTVETAVEATRLGALDFVEKPLSMGKLLATVEDALKSSPTAQGSREGVSSDIIMPVGRSQVMEACRSRVARIAGARGGVIIDGEAGSGKNCFAQYLHSLSAGASGPLLELQAGALHGKDAARELYGEAGGTKGWLEAAAEGTLIINEVADLDEEAQLRLASAVAADAFQRLGESATLPLTARLVATSRRDLAAAVTAGRLRKDLYYKLGVLTLTIPPLREHVEDVPELTSFFVDRLVEEQGLPYRRFTVAAQNRLRNHDWPGNVRELRNLVHRLLAVGEGLEVEVDEVEAALGPPAHDDESASGEYRQDLLDLPLREAREAFERDYLQYQLRRAGGSVAQLARLTGMERTHLYRKLRSLGIDPRESG
jgi:DNA-binding NtrC family response regulator